MRLWSTAHLGIESVSRVARRGLSATVYRRLVVLHLPLERPIECLEPRLPVLIQPLRESEVDDYLQFRPDARAREVRRRLASGCRCFAARYQGRIVHAGWISTSSAWIDYLGCEMPLARGEVYQFGSFTAPAFRGFGIAAARVAAMAEALRREGYRRLIACVLPGSAAAFRPLERVGYMVIGDIRVVRLGPWRRIRRRLRRDPDGVSSAYWDAVLDDMRMASPIDAWRGYMRRVYAELIRQWLPSAPAGLGLKTDLFEEAVTHHEVLSALGPGSVGVDVSPAVALAARQRLGERDRSHRFIVGDLRQAPLRSESVARVLAGSSLDHFADKADIAASLAELARVLVPGGVLLLTLDNPHNPAIWLRNHLPFALLKRLRLVPYYVGATYGQAEARAHLEALGFHVTDVSAVAHAPRAPAVWLAALIDRHRRGLTPTRLERLLWSCEALGRWPTRYVTGYYLAVRAVRRQSAEPKL